MILTASGLIASAPLHANESYLELLSSRPHWPFEITLEVVSAPAVFLAGRAWRKGVLQHPQLDPDVHASASTDASGDDELAQPAVWPCRDGWDMVVLRESVN